MLPIQRELNSNLKPRVVLSAGNVSLYHHAALALQNAGYLRQYFCVFSGYKDFGPFQPLLPAKWRKRILGKYLNDLDRHYIKTITWPYLVTQSSQRIGRWDLETVNLHFNTWYDAITRRSLPPCDVFHFVNGMGLKTAQQACERGCITVCDVRAAYIDFEEIIMKEEYARLGLEYQSTRHILHERLLEEYAIADAIIVNSQYVFDTFQKHGISTQKMFIVPRGVDLTRFGQKHIEEKVVENKEEDIFKVLFVGRVNPGKGLHYLLEAMGNLRIPQSELLIVGNINESHYQTYLENLIKQYNISITFLGHLPQLELWRIYQMSDLFVLPTLSEGSALVIYEAMAAGLPILTTEYAGSIITDGEEGYVVPIRDPIAMREKIKFLFEHPDIRREMGRCARQRVQDFTWERYGQRLLAVYDKIWAGKE